MKYLVLLSSVLFLNFAAESAATKKNVVCYFASWTTYRPGKGKFDIENIDTDLCTHINFGFIGLNEDASIHILDPWESDASGLNGFARLVALKNKKPGLKILVSMGGWNEGSSTYSNVSADPAKRKILAQNVLNFLEEKNFDGFDLDWEYPGLRGGNETIDKNDFTNLLKELSIVLKPKGYLLTAAVASAMEKIDEAYDVPSLNNLVDMLNVMVFDFHGAFENFVGHISPLFPAEIDYKFEDNRTYNVDSGIQHWLSQGAKPTKLNLGIATYGRSFTLADSKNTSLYAPVLKGGVAGPYSRQSGILGYNEICEYHSNSTYVWDDEQQVPHRIWDDQWVGFDDEKSIELKMQYALDNQLGGAMVWSFDYDDFMGTCGEKYPLLKAVNKGLKNL